jgi:hypothetical protein
MGNCTPNKQPAHKPKVKLNIKWTGVFDIDDLFRAIASPLQSLNELSKSLRKRTKKFKKSTFSHVVLNWTLSDSLYSMLYIFEANQENIKENLDFKIINDPPYLKLDKNRLPHDLVKVYEDFEALMQVLIDAPDQLLDLKPQILNFAQEAVDFPDKAKDICKNCNMGPTEIVKTSKRVTKNVQKIMNGKTVVEETEENVRKFSECIQDFCRSYDVYLPRVEELGRKARNDNCLHPKQIVTKYWPELNRIDLALDLPPKAKQKK